MKLFTFSFRLLLPLFALAFAQTACASADKLAGQPGPIYGASGKDEVSLSVVLEKVTPGSVAIVSEQHGFKPHHENQVRFLEALTAMLSERGETPAVSVGMEFFSYPEQSRVDYFLTGHLTEEEFLKAVSWPGGDFANYRRQTLFPRENGGRTLALNAPRSLTGRIARVGLAGLTDAERTLLPPDMAPGNSRYFERFKEVMKDHVPADALGRYFEAQSVWDDTMSWIAADFLRRYPNQRLVIIVGDFHAAYGGGLPERLRARGITNVLTVSQVNLHGLSEEEGRALIEPHPNWGPRADFIWAEK